MSNYATTAHMRQRLDLPNISIQIEQLAGTNNYASQDLMIEQFMEEACGLIDAYLNNKYIVPVTTTANNPFLRGLALDISVHEMFKRGSGDKVPAKYRTNYEDVIRSLEDIAEGSMSVPGVAARVKNTSIELETDTRQFSEDKLTKYF